MSTPLSELIAYLSEFNEVQLDVLRASCAGASAYPLLITVVEHCIEAERSRRYRRGAAARLPALREHPADALMAAADDAHRIATSLVSLGRAHLTRAEALPVIVFLELLGARLLACAETPPVIHA